MSTRTATRRLSSEKSSVLTKEALHDLNLHEFDVMDGWEPTAGKIYTKVRAISARINQNFDGWPSEELKKSYRTFLGKPVFVNHVNDDPRKARGVVVAARFVDAEDDKYIEVIQEVDADRFPILAHELVTGGLDSVSMGAEARICKCSYCGNEAGDMLSMCSHVLGQKGQILGKVNSDGTREDILIYEECRDISFFELSYVFDPADETAVVSNVLTANKKRGYGETSLPSQVDTLRDEEEDLGGYFIEPPIEFQDPDLDKEYPAIEKGDPLDNRSSEDEREEYEMTRVSRGHRRGRPSSRQAGYEDEWHESWPPLSDKGRATGIDWEALDNAAGYDRRDPNPYDDLKPRKSSRRGRNMPNKARMSRRRRYAEEFGRNDQGEQEEVFISQTPPAEPVETGEGASDAPNNSKSDRVKTDQNRSTHTNLEARRRRARRHTAAEDLYMDFLEYAQGQGFDLDHMQNAYDEHYKMEGTGPEADQADRDVHDFESAMYDFLDVTSVDQDDRLYELLDAPGIHEINHPNNFRSSSRKRRSNRRRKANGDSFEVHDNGVVEVFDADSYLRSNPDADIVTDGHDGRMWDDSVATSLTPTPGGRSPFEFDRDYEDEDDDYTYSSRRRRSSRRKRANESLYTLTLDNGESYPVDSGSDLVHWAKDRYYGDNDALDTLDEMASVIDSGGHGWDHADALGLNLEKNSSVKPQRRARRRMAEQSDDFDLNSRADIARDVEDEDLFDAPVETQPKDASRKRRPSARRRNNRQARRRASRAPLRLIQSMTVNLRGPHKTAEYNGWSNWETWNTALWYGNDPGAYEMAKGAQSPEELRENAPYVVGDEVDFDQVDWNEVYDAFEEDRTASLRRVRVANIRGPRKTADYNGWSNWETWNTALWYGNDPGAYDLAKSARSPEELAENAPYVVGDDVDFDQVNWDEVYDAFEEDRTASRKRRSSRRGSSRSRRTAVNGWANWDTWHANMYLGDHDDIARDIAFAGSGQQVADMFSELLEGTDVDPDNVDWDELHDVYSSDQDYYKDASRKRRSSKRRRMADTNLDLAAPDGRVNVEAPTSGTTDEEAQASQFDKGDYGHNAGDNLADPDLSTDQNWAPGEGKQSSNRASQIEGMRLAEAMVEAGLEKHDDRWKLAETYTKLPSSIVRDRIALLSRTASVKSSSRDDNGQRPIKSARKSPGLGQGPSLQKAASNQSDDYSLYF